MPVPILESPAESHGPSHRYVLTCCLAAFVIAGCGSPADDETETDSAANPAAVKTQITDERPRVRTALADESQTVRMIEVDTNFAVDSAAERLAIIDRAMAVGANTVLLDDAKLSRWGIGEAVGERWLHEMRAFREGVLTRQMKLVMNTITLGDCNALLAADPNLTTGYPIIDQPMRALDGRLVPVSTSGILNGGFERSTGNVPAGWSFQDEPGIRTFVDRHVAHSGSASFRADARGGNAARIQTLVAVKPWHQYTLKFWVRTANLSARPAVLIGYPDSAVTLTAQLLSRPGTDGTRDYIERADQLDLQWTEMRIAFNSQANDSVRLVLGLFGGNAGSMWVDDLSIADTPTLNWVRRSDLPVSARLENGANLSVDTDVSLPVDPRLGELAYTGNFGTYHDGPTPQVLAGNALSEGDTVLLSGWHAQVTAAGQIGCSWLAPDVRALMRRAHQRIQGEFNPDGYLLDYSEIRTGGFEPADKAFGNSGAALAASIAGAYQDLFQIAPNASHYFWSDMVDPVHNARAGYYQVANTLDGSWRSLDPSRVTIINWWSGLNVLDKGPTSLKHFSDLGFKQVLGAFWDDDVAANFQRWQIAGKDVAGIEASLYATQEDNYGEIEAFGFLWW